MALAGRRFRPCIDLHDGAVKQIVGGTLKDSSEGEGLAEGVVENFVSEKPPAFYAELCAPPGLSSKPELRAAGLTRLTVCRQAAFT